MRAAFDNLALLYHDDGVRSTYGAKTVANNDGRFVLVVAKDIIKDVVFGLGIDGRGGFVQNQYARATVECARQRYALPLAAAGFDAFFEAVVEHGVPAVFVFVYK